MYSIRVLMLPPIWTSRTGRARTPNTDDSTNSHYNTPYYSRYPHSQTSTYSTSGGAHGLQPDLHRPNRDAHEFDHQPRAERSSHDQNFLPLRQQLSLYCSSLISLDYSILFRVCYSVTRTVCTRTVYSYL